jgi:hypothetical protein
MATENNGQKIWWRDPAKIAAVVTIIAMIGGFIYSRERQLVILSERILTFEERASKRVEEFNEKVENVKQLTTLNERGIQTMNERLTNDESLIRENSNRITRMEAIIDRLFPQGSSTPIRK